MGTMQIGLIFSSFDVLFSLAMGSSMAELTPMSSLKVMARLNSSAMVIDALLHACFRSSAITLDTFQFFH